MAAWGGEGGGGGQGSAAGAQRVAEILHIKRLATGVTEETAHDAISQKTRTITIKLSHKPQAVSYIQQWQQPDNTNF